MTEDKPKRTRINQSDVPAYPLTEALKVPEAIADEFARQPVKPLRLAQALDMKPSSSRFRTLTGAAVAYGLTTAAYNSSEIGLTELGKKCVAPTYDGQDAAAKKQAFMKPRIFAKLMQTYNGTKFPSGGIGVNVLVDMGIAVERAAGVLDMIRSGGQALGLMKEIKGELYVDIDRPAPVQMTTSENNNIDVITEPAITPQPKLGQAGQARVFVAQSGNDEIAGQLKELLVFGKFEPVKADGGPLSAETVDTMRSCATAVLHIGQTIGETELIKIGAAMALYGDGFVLLVERTTGLPASIQGQGMHEVRYEGDKLDYEATMNLLKAFNDISAG